MAGGGAAEKTGHYEGGLRGEWENGAEMRGLARYCGGGRGLWRRAIAGEADNNCKLRR